MFTSTTATPIQPVPWKIYRAKDSTNSTIEYMGYAPPYTDESLGLNVMIIRNTYGASDGGLSLSDHPVGQQDDSGRMIANQTWALRESLVYG